MKRILTFILFGLSFPLFLTASENPPTKWAEISMMGPISNSDMKSMKQCIRSLNFPEVYIKKVYWIRELWGTKKIIFHLSVSSCVTMQEFKKEFIQAMKKYKFANEFILLMGEDVSHLSFCSGGNLWNSY